MRGEGNQKAAHIKGQRKRMINFAGKPLDHGRRMGSRQILDTGTTSLYLANTEHGEVGGQRFRGHGLVVGKGEKSIFEVSAQALLGRCPAG